MKKLYVIAGEPSGDFLGAGIISELMKIENLQIFGIGGKLMENAGLQSLFDIKEISVGGIFEVIPHIFKIKRLIEKTLDDVINKNPDILLTIDSPGFCFRIARIVKKRNPKIKLVHLVAPSVWAWRPNRAKKLARLYDHLLTLFDFEPPYFTKYGLPTTFVGHSAIEYFKESAMEKENLLLILPGSRDQEIKSLLPIFLEASRHLNFERIVIPTLPHLESLIRSIVGNDSVIEIVSEEIKKNQLFQRAKCAIVASGTATLQLALSGCPMVVCYKLASLSYHIMKLMVKVPYISLVNLILNKKVVPELIQNDCDSEKISKAINSLDFEKQREDFRNLRKKLQPENLNPTAKISKILIDLFR